MQNANHASGFSRFSWSADSREEDKTWKKEREREGTWSAEADITEQPLHTHCGHPASLLFHAAKYRVLFTRRFQPRRWKLAVGPRNGASYSSCVDKNGRLCDGIFPPLLSFPLSKFSFFQVESGGERILNVRFRFSSSKVSWKVKVAAGVTG